MAVDPEHFRPVDPDVGTLVGLLTRAYSEQQIMETAYLLLVHTILMDSRTEEDWRSGLAAVVHDLEGCVRINFEDPGATRN